MRFASYMAASASCRTCSGMSSPRPAKATPTLALTRTSRPESTKGVASAVPIRAASDFDPDGLVEVLAEDDELVP